MIDLLASSMNVVTFGSAGFAWFYAGAWWEPDPIIRFIEGAIIVLTAIMNFIKLINDLRKK
jgi:hypothetical protein